MTRRKPAMKKLTVKAQDIRTRDLNMVAIINGATKSGAHKDRRKEADRKACRRRVREEE